MTLDELRNRPEGIIAKRSFSVNYKGWKTDEHYYLVKCRDGKYFIGFSEHGYYSNVVSEKHMLELINDTEASDEVAADIYYSDSHLNCWLTHN